MARFSVVIPIFNKVSHIEATLASVLKQTFHDFEVILVNDGSTDGSRQVIDRFKDQRIVIIDQENQGLSRARNVGIKTARNPIIALLDADDLWKPKHLENLNFLVEQFPEASTFGTGYEEIFSNGKVVKPHLSELNYDLKPSVLEDFFKANMHQPLVAPSSFAFKKELVSTIGDFNPNVTYSEDVDFYIRAHLNHKMAYHPEITCTYTMEAENQITRSKKSDRKIPDFQQYLDENPNHDSLKKYINLKRYFLAIFYKVEGRAEMFHEMRENIDENLLTKKQNQLLKAPKNVVIGLRWIKAFLLKRGRRFTSF